MADRGETSTDPYDAPGSPAGGGSDQPSDVLTQAIRPDSTGRTASPPGGLPPSGFTGAYGSPGGYPPYPYPYPYSYGSMPPPGSGSARGFAIASLVCSLGALAAGFIGSILGIVFGFVARGRMRSSGNYDGQGMATAGIAIGFVGLALGALLLAVAVPLFIGVVSQVSSGVTAQDNLSNSLSHARSQYLRSSTFASPALLQHVLAVDAPQLTFQADGSVSTADDIGLDVSSAGDAVMLWTRASNGTCWAIASNEAAGTEMVGSVPVRNGTVYASYGGSRGRCGEPGSGVSWHQNGFPL